MRINTSFKDFRNRHLKKAHQILFKSFECKNYYKVENLFKFLLAEKNSFIFESVEKGIIRGRYTIIGLNPDKLWDINNNTVTIETNKKKVLSNCDKSTKLNRVNSLNIICSSKILFRNKDNKIFAPTTKFKNLFLVSLNPITCVSPK